MAKKGGGQVVGDGDVAQRGLDVILVQFGVVLHWTLQLMEEAYRQDESQVFG